MRCSITSGHLVVAGGDNGMSLYGVTEELGQSSRISQSREWSKAGRSCSKAGSYLAKTHRCSVASSRVVYEPELIGVTGVS